MSNNLHTRTHCARHDIGKVRISTSISFSRFGQTVNRIPSRRPNTVVSDTAQPRPRTSGHNNSMRHIQYVFYDFSEAVLALVQWGSFSGKNITQQILPASPMMKLKLKQNIGQTSLQSSNDNNCHLVTALKNTTLVTLDWEEKSTHTMWRALLRS